MVQLKWPRRYCPRRHHKVLIPVWCNWNYINEFVKVWSIFVLIPVWCNWNIYERAERLTKDHRFNSCMVQLKFFIHSFCCFCLWGFNSCMVQLKYDHKYYSCLRAYCFNSCMVQLKCARGGQALETRNSFNSCMVQLKYYSCCSSIIRLRCFNSCMVQLKSSANIAFLPFVLRFNSCMVQLKFLQRWEHKPSKTVLIPVWCNWN